MILDERHHRVKSDPSEGAFDPIRSLTGLFEGLYTWGGSAFTLSHGSSDESPAESSGHGVMHKRSVLPLLASLVLPGCGDPVTNPLYEGFEADPAPILGTWHMVGEDGATDATDARYPFVIVRGAGYLFGEVRFHMFSQSWEMKFNDVRDWDGTEFHFDHHETHGLTIDRLRWTVRYQPAWEQQCPSGWSGGRTYPAQLVLSGPRSMTFRRPGETSPRDGSLICRPPE